MTLFWPYFWPKNDPKNRPKNGLFSLLGHSLFPIGQFGRKWTPKMAQKWTQKWPKNGHFGHFWAISGTPPFYPPKQILAKNGQNGPKRGFPGMTPKWPKMAYLAYWPYGPYWWIYLSISIGKSQGPKGRTHPQNGHFDCISMGNHHWTMPKSGIANAGICPKWPFWLYFNGKSPLGNAEIRHCQCRDMPKMA